MRGRGALQKGKHAVAVTTRAAALMMTSADINQAGVIFNDSTRLLEGGLWSTPSDANNQNNYTDMYTADITQVVADVNAYAAANPAIMINDQQHLTTIQQDLATLLQAAPVAGANGGGANQADGALHAAQLDIINLANTDANFAGLAQALPQGSLADGVAATNNTPHATLAEIGQIFNSAADLAVGGLDNGNTRETFNKDMQVVETGVQGILNDPNALAAITNGDPADAALSLLHLQTVAQQVSLQINDFDHQYGNNPVAGRSTNDNVLDIIDIVQGDPALAAAANADNANGFGNFPDYLTGTITKFQDDQAQTNFWSNFVAGGNQIAADAQAYVANPTPAGAAALTTEVNNFHTFVGNFDKAQGGVFEARFDNELAPVGSTNAADTNAILDGIKTNNSNEILAAASGFQANEADVSGNNIPVHGGAYDNAATTQAAATNPAGQAIPTGPGNPGTPLHQVNPNNGMANNGGAGQDASAGHSGGLYGTDDSHTAAVDYSHIWHHA
jgi:hypothetical protein